MIFKGHDVRSINFPVYYTPHDHNSFFLQFKNTTAKFQNPSINFSSETQIFTSNLVTMKALLWFMMLVFSVNSLRSESKRTKVAYASLLYGDEFLLGVRVLGKSIRDTRSNKDMVVLVSDGVSNYAKNLLKVHSHFHFSSIL